MPLQMFKAKDFLKLFIKLFFLKTWVFELILRDFKEKVLFPFGRVLLTFQGKTITKCIFGLNWAVSTLFTFTEFVYNF